MNILVRESETRGRDLGVGEKTNRRFVIINKQANKKFLIRREINNDNNDNEFIPDSNVCTRPNL